MAGRTIYVYVSWSSDEPVLMGFLYVEALRGKESCSYEYEPGWPRMHPGQYFLDPDLQLYEGRQYVPMDKTLFGLFADSCPDRWGSF